MKPRFILTLMFLGGFLSMQGQLTKLKVAETPLAYQKPVDGVSESILPPKKGSRKWKVYVANGQATCYKTAALQNPRRRLDFMSSYYVAAATATGLRLVTYDPDALGNKSKFSNMAQEVGWVKRSDLLLWNTPLRDPNTGFKLTGMTTISPQDMRIEIERLSAQGELKLEIYDDQELTVPNGNDSRLYELFFVYKKQGDAVLLGRSPSVTPFDAKNLIVGWVHTKHLTFWKSRHALEPDWSHVPAAERRNAAIHPAVVKTVGAAKSLKTGATPENAQVLTQKDPLQNRSDPPIKRLALVSRPDSGIAKVIYVTDVYTRSGEVVEREEYDKEVVDQYENLKSVRKRINVILVMDGTSSMGEYYEPVCRALENSMNFIQASDADCRFGAVVYRDYAESNCPGEDRLVQTSSLNSDPRELARFLRGIEAGDCQDTDKHEAVFHGITTALEKFRLVPNQTNLMVLVGDAGNHAKNARYTTDDMVKQLVRHNIGLLAFQVHNGQHPAYDDFINQFLTVIPQACRGIANRYSNLYKNRGVNRPVFRMAGPNVFRIRQSPVPAALIHANKGDHLNTQVLENEISALLRSTFEMNNRIFIHLDELIEGSKVRVLDTTFTDNFEEGLKQILGFMDLPPRLRKLIQVGNVQFAVEGFTATQHPNLSHDLYQNVLLLDHDEIAQLRTTMKKLWDPSLSADGLRESLCQAYKNLLQVHFGVNRREIDEMDLGAVVQLITGVPCRNGVLCEYKIKHICDSKGLSDGKLEEIVAIFRKSYTALGEYTTAEPDQSFLSSGRKFYWIPQSLLP